MKKNKNEKGVALIAIMVAVIVILVAIIIAMVVVITNKDIENDEGNVITANIATNELNDETNVEENTTNTSTGSTTQDMSSITTVEATLENPAQIGEWVETKHYSTGDHDYHTVYYRITEVIRGTESDEPQNTVDAYNEEGHVTYFSEIENDDLEYNIVKYEVYFPTDFPESSNGNITSPDLDFSIKSPDGGGVEANGVSWIGLSCYDITETSTDIYPGDTMTEGIGIFSMVKNCSDYLFAVSNYDDDNTYTYVQGK